MTRAGKLCNTPGCPNLQPCTDHLKRAWSGSSRRERTSSGWQQQRDARTVMRLHDGICHVCHLPGADQVDHVIPTAPDAREPQHRDLPLTFVDSLENKRPIHSDPCHKDKTAAEAQRARGRR